MFRVEEISDDSSAALNHGVVKVTPVDPIKVGEVTVEPRACVLNHGMVNNIERIANFHIREDDVWILSYPKCGTTWVQEMCWLILNDFDFEGAKKIDIGKRGPFLEYSDLCNIANMDSIENCKNLKSPRFLKSHLPLPVLPRELWTKHPKIVYVVRDPRDAAISYFHHISKWYGLDNTKEEFLNWSLNSQIIYAPYWDHAIEFWNIRHQPNVLFLTYEDMKANLQTIIQQACDFFNKTISEDQMTKMLEHLSFESMKANEAAQHNFERSLIEVENFDSNFRFVRRGAIGSYKDEFPPHFIELYNEWMRENLERTDFDYYKKYL